MWDSFRYFATTPSEQSIAPPKSKIGNSSQHGFPTKFQILHGNYHHLPYQPRPFSRPNRSRAPARWSACRGDGPGCCVSGTHSEARRSPSRIAVERTTCETQRGKFQHKKATSDMSFMKRLCFSVKYDEKQLIFCFALDPRVYVFTSSLREHRLYFSVTPPRFGLCCRPFEGSREYALDVPVGELASGSVEPHQPAL